MGGLFLERDLITYSQGQQEETDILTELVTEKKLNSWRENNVYEEVEWDRGMKLVNTKWILKEKDKDGGKMWKARLVPKGFTERFGQKYECEALTCSVEGLKLVLTVLKT